MKCPTLCFAKKKKCSDFVARYQNGPLFPRGKFNNDLIFSSNLLMLTVNLYLMKLWFSYFSAFDKKLWNSDFKLVPRAKVGVPLPADTIQELTFGFRVLGLQWKVNVSTATCRF